MSAVKALRSLGLPYEDVDNGIHKGTSSKNWLCLSIYLIISHLVLIYGHTVLSGSGPDLRGLVEPCCPASGNIFTFRGLRMIAHLRLLILNVRAWE